MGFFCLWCNPRPRGTKQASTTILELELCHQFSFAEIQSATCNFNKSFIIGHGAFGSTVYKGFLEKSCDQVAIKRCSKKSIYGLSEIRNEVVLLCQLQHPNLMPFLGFCAERNELVLVYKLMPNGSLHDHLHGGIGSFKSPLSWNRRLQICIGVARALHYLHTGAKYVIIHRDVNTRYILLDNNLDAKVSGLFLSKRGPLSISKSLIKVVSPVMGTYGYTDPEYAATGVLSEKSDVYSFGVVLLEVLSAKQAQDIYKEHLEKENCNQSLKSYAEEIVDPFLKSKIAPDCWKTFIDITERCLLKEGRERPDMGEVELHLEHALKSQEEADAKI
ncbi:hypothetical protein PIB30_061437 [Stylosanthes scabra]|uniref:Protein kinase domain-containing protein n=1 Tax=Stylosanthes scabra TaxID=79078 RepID=A0ABU6QKP4_9FABA|nr:hypothetical protein [Stylosanthes scabra]